MLVWSPVVIAQVPPASEPAVTASEPVSAAPEPATAAANEQPPPPPTADVNLQPVTEPVPEATAAPADARVTAVGAQAPAPDAGVAPPSDAADAPAEEDEGKVEKGPKLSLGMRVIGGFQYEKDGGEPEASYGFNLRQVRVSTKLKWKKRWTARATVDFSDGLNPSGVGVQYLRTAVLEYKYSPAFRLVVGRYKRPFSHLELQSTGDLPILNRGLLNGLIVEDSAWGDRGIGAMVSGKYKPARLGWAFSLTNPAPDNLATPGIDAIARLTWKPIDEVQLGVHGGNKYLDFETGRKHFQGVGGDVTLHFGGFEWQLEGMMADLPWRNSIGYGGTSLMSYSQPITKHLRLQPVLFAEYADSNSEFERNESVRLQGGVNVVIRDRFRIMPQVRKTQALGDPLRSAPTSSPEFAAINPWKDSTQWSLYLSLAL